MFRRLFPSLIVLLVLAAAAPAQTVPRFRWQAEQVHTYRVEQTTTIEEVLGDRKTTVTTKLTLVKRWQVVEVDAAGVATLRLSLAALRNEIARPNGETLLFDSAEPDKSTPEMREQLAKYVGSVLAEVRVDTKGAVVAVKKSEFGPASRFESDPPFKVVLGDDAAVWTRAYKVTLEPPAGTGEKFDATQSYSAKPAANGGLVITLATEIGKMPDNPLDRVPLLQSLPTGEVVFDAATGTMRSAKLRVDKELKGHRGEGSSYHFQSSYTEERVAEPRSSGG